MKSRMERENGQCGTMELRERHSYTHLTVCKASPKRRNGLRGPVLGAQFVGAMLLAAAGIVQQVMAKRSWGVLLVRQGQYNAEAEFEKGVTALRQMWEEASPIVKRDFGLRHTFLASPTSNPISLYEKEIKNLRAEKATLGLWGNDIDRTVYTLRLRLFMAVMQVALHRLRGIKELENLYSATFVPSPPELTAQREDLMGVRQFLSAFIHQQLDPLEADDTQDSKIPSWLALALRNGILATDQLRLHDITAATIFNDIMDDIDSEMPTRESLMAPGLASLRTKRFKSAIQDIVGKRLGEKVLPRTYEFWKPKWTVKSLAAQLVTLRRNWKSQRRREMTQKNGLKLEWDNAEQPLDSIYLLALAQL